MAKNTLQNLVYPIENIINNLAKKLTKVLRITQARLLYYILLLRCCQHFYIKNLSNFFSVQLELMDIRGIMKYSPAQMRNSFG